MSSLGTEVLEVPEPDHVQAAMAALAVAQSDPRRAAALAAVIRTRSLDAGDLHAAAVAERAMGLSARAMFDVHGSVRHLRRAVRLARNAGEPTLAAEAQMSLSFSLALAGKHQQALVEADRAEPALRGVNSACLKMQRALILQHMGRLEEALNGYRRALPVFERAGDQLRQARLLTNRGVLHLRLGCLGLAERDLTRAHSLFTSLGDQRMAAGAVHDLGFVAFRRGDIPGALKRFDRAEEELRGDGIPFVFAFDRCELLLTVRLTGEARRCAEESVAALTAGRMESHLAEAHLMLAEAAILQGDLTQAGRSAGLAHRAFVQQGRPAWATLARYSSLRVSWLAGDRSESSHLCARRVADRLAAAGWPVTALDARLIAARMALESGHPVAARHDLERASRARRRGPVDLRARAWHAEALLREASGNRRGALAAVEAGLTTVERHRALLGATELRVHAGGHGQALASLGVSLALQSKRADRVLRWAERWRAAAGRQRPVRPPEDARATALLAELRQVMADIDLAALAGRDTARLVGRQTTLEDQIARHCRALSPATVHEAEARLDLPALETALGDRALVELVDCNGSLYAVVVVSGGCRLAQLAPVAAVTSETESLRFGLRRIAWRTGAPASRMAAKAAVLYAAERLDQMIMGPLRAWLGPQDLVMVPTGPLHALPWALLPSCRGRSVSIAPSAVSWARAAQSQRATKPETVEGSPAPAVLLVAGPGLPAAADEVTALARRYPSATVLRGADATVPAVMSEMERATLVHFAAHGAFRADNPLFSNLQLADGPLHVHDLEALRAVPEQIILAACDSGTSSVHPGDELMGLAAAFLALGTRSLVASLMPVPDRATAPLMLAVHDRMSGGASPAAALAAAAVTASEGDDAGLAVAAAFACFGAG